MDLSHQSCCGEVVHYLATISFTITRFSTLNFGLCIIEFLKFDKLISQMLSEYLVLQSRTSGLLVKVKGENDNYER